MNPDAFAQSMKAIKLIADDMDVVWSESPYDPSRRFQYRKWKTEHLARVTQLRLLNQIAESLTEISQHLQFEYVLREEAQANRPM